MITCEFEKGPKTSLRHVVVDALIVEDSKILLIKRAEHLINGGKYALPGGYLDRDETAQQAVVREVMEETGYKVEVDKLFKIIDNPDRPQEDRQNVAFIYVVRLLEKIGEHDPSEVSEVKWFDLAQLPSDDEFAFDHYQTILEYKKKYTA